jgi:adenylate kinase family enzyme
MSRIVVIGNSGSGKSTLAKRLPGRHLDLDTLAWLPGPKRRPIDESRRDIDAFTSANETWVIEGCYADLAAIALERATTLIFLNLPVEACIANARERPWEPHKYESQEAQDANLAMLIDWIRAYETRTDELSLHAHGALWKAFRGNKFELKSRQEIGEFRL